MSNELKKITATFNIFDNGRKHTGTKRNYVLENWKKEINDPILQERIKLGELEGYVGHGIRELTSLSPKETDLATLPNGQKVIVSTDPSHRCTEISIDDNGNVTHTQEVLATKEGKRLLALHNSKFGGFSIAAGNGGNAGNSTLLNGIHGFDYVKNPNFAANKGYVLDDADAEKVVLAALQDIGDEDPRLILDSWQSSLPDYEQEILGVEEKLIDLGIENKSLQSELESVRALLDSAVSEKEKAVLDFDEKTQSFKSAIMSEREAVIELKEKEERRRRAFEVALASSIVATPKTVIDSLIGAQSTDDLSPFLEHMTSCAGIDGGSLPIGEHTPVFVGGDYLETGDDIPDYI